MRVLSELVFSTNVEIHRLLHDNPRFSVFICLSTYDHIYYFSTLYTTLPHNLIKEKLTELIEKTFNREGSLYLACNDKNAFLLVNNLNDINCGHVRKCVMISIIFWIIYL